jgi:hypothetical protein
VLLPGRRIRRQRHRRDVEGAAQDGGERLAQHARFGRLRNEAGGTRIDRRQHDLGPLVGREHDGARRRRSVSYRLQRGQPGAVGQREVEQHEVDIGLGGQQCTRHLQPTGVAKVDVGVMQRDQQGERVAHQRMVVDEQALHRPGLSATARPSGRWREGVAIRTLRPANSQEIP